MAASPSVSRTVPGQGGVLLFRLSGVPVLLSASWWIGSLVIVLLYTPLVRQLLPGTTPVGAVLLSATFAILLGVSVLAHELGHCVVALRMGMGVHRLRLSLLGGQTEMVRSPRTPGQEGLVAAAGPAVSVLLAAMFGVLLLAVPDYGSPWLLIAECAVANLVVAVFNVLPGLPLDGGRMLRALVWSASGRRPLGTRIAAAGAGLVATAILVWAVCGLIFSAEGKWLRLGVCVITAWFVIVGARQELSAELRREWPPGLRLSDVLRPVLQLPAESPVVDALAASAGRGVVLVRADGIAAGLLDEANARQLADSSPRSPAEHAAEPIGAANVLMDSEAGADVLDRVHGTSAWQFLVIDEQGRPCGVLRREDLRTALEARRQR